ncbi:MAG: hypothetical protein KC733_03260 [Candidatus Omnitrophica bacterium]|nr:hypothetical protein [Candidatus Omnitrophota bacterium]
MIVKIAGNLSEKKEQSLILEVNGIYYEVFVPISVLSRIDDTKDSQGRVHLVIYHFYQMTPSSATPLMIGFISEVERDFFLQFIKVSGIGPKAAIKALNQSIAEITRAIDAGDVAYLKTLPGIGLQRAKEIVAKLQGKVGKYGLIKDREVVHPKKVVGADWQQEALSVLLQLQYTKQEAEKMIDKALERSQNIMTTEDLLNEIYKQKAAL